MDKLALWCLAMCAALLSRSVGAEAPIPMSAQERESWFESKGASEVNEGHLTFLVARPVKPVHHHQNRILITPDSLVSGWIELFQCHDHLDAVPRAQITFRAGFVRGLHVVESSSIGDARVEGATIQLRDIAPGARLCLKTQTRALSDAGRGNFTLSNGPYMRKFLDGYYPMRVSLVVAYPADRLRLVAVSPEARPGFRVTAGEGVIDIDAFFEGELRTQIAFEGGQ